MSLGKHKDLVIGFTTSPYQFLELGEKARAAGFKNIDCTMPYPVHGFEEAYGLKGSWIGLAAFAALMSGWIGGFAMQAWMMGADYNINFAGKPFIPWPAFIPVTFECGILLTAFTTIGSLLLAAGLKPQPKLKVINDRCTDDLFSIIIPTNTDEEKNRAESWLKDQGLADVDFFHPDYFTINQKALKK